MAEQEEQKLRFIHHILFTTGPREYIILTLLTMERPHFKPACINITVKTLLTYSTVADTN